MNIPALVLTYIILQVMDIQITEIVIQHPLIMEANPMYYILGWDTLVLHKTIIMIATAVFLLFAGCIRWREIKWAMTVAAWLTVLISALPVINNLLLAWRYN